VTVKIRRRETNATLCEFTLEGSVVHLVKFMKDGQNVGLNKDGSADLLAWDEHGQFSAEAEVEIRLVPLGADGPIVIPLPLMRFSLVLGDKGGFRVTCLEANECPYETLAEIAFDVAHFRQLLVESFLLDYQPLKDVKGKSTLRICLRILFPTSTVSQILASWFRGFVKSQFEELDILKLFRDFLAAVRQDFDAVQ